MQPGISLHKLLAFESDFDPMRIRYRDVEIWRLIRLGLVGAGDMRAMKATETAFRGKLRRILRTGLTLLGKGTVVLLARRYTFRRGVANSAGGVCAVTFENDLRGRRAGRVWDVFADPLRPYLNVTSLHRSVRYKRPRGPVYPHLQTWDLDVLGILASVSGRIAECCNPAALGLVSAAERFLTGSSYADDDGLRGAIRRACRLVDIVLPYARALFRRYRPRAFVCITGYDPLVATLVAAANLEGVPTFELQHGTITAEHLGYVYSPGPGVIPYSSVSRHLLLWGPHFADVLESSGSFWSRERIHAVGYPWLDINVHHDADPAGEVANELARWKGARKLILITSQPKVSLRLAEHLRREVERLHSEIAFIVKLHPGEGKAVAELYRAVDPTENRLRVVGDDLVSTYELLRMSEAHASVFSSVLWEAPAFGIPNFVVSLPGSEAAQDVVRLGLAETVEGLGDVTPRRIRESCARMQGAREVLNQVFTCLDGKRAEEVSALIWRLSAGSRESFATPSACC